MLPANTRVLKDPETVAIEACRLVVAAANAAIRARKVFRLVLAGGNTPGRAYELLAATVQTWAAWEIYWGDERCLPADHPGRNSRMAQLAWLGYVPIPQRQIYPIAAELDAMEAAADYARAIHDKLPFDLVLLGMGEDGHTASLFPGAVVGADPVIAVSDAPKPPAERVSLGYRALRQCRSQLVLITGAAKADALAGWRRGGDLPIARAVRSDACLLVDEALRKAAGIPALHLCAR